MHNKRPRPEAEAPGTEAQTAARPRPSRNRGVIWVLVLRPSQAMEYTQGWEKRERACYRADLVQKRSLGCTSSLKIAPISCRM